MEIPILNTLLAPAHRWPDMLRRHPELEEDWRAMLVDFESQASDIINSTLRTALGRSAEWLHRLVSPQSEVYKAELKGVAQYLGVDKDVALAGQLVYDASTVHGIDAVCGCTSAAQMYQGRPWHGRLMDWSWPESIRDRVRLIQVTGRHGDYIAEHIPGTTGFVGAYTHNLAANLNQAPTSRLRWTATPALWWFREAFENGRFDRPGYAPNGGMTDALIHVTHRKPEVTSRFYYMGGIPHVRRDRLSSTPVVLSNTFDMDVVEEDPDGYAWSKWREDAVTNSRKRVPMRRLGEAECDDTIHRWSVSL
jgi:hypothetical protein